MQQLVFNVPFYKQNPSKIILQLLFQTYINSKMFKVLPVLIIKFDFVHYCYYHGKIIQHSKERSNSVVI